MPKELYEIRNFNLGTVSTPSEEDIPPNAASESLDVESVSVDGVLTGRKDDETFSVTNMVNADFAEWIDEPSTRTLITYDTATRKFYKVESFHGGSTPSMVNIKNLTTTQVTMVPNQKELHIGTGSNSSSTSLWIGYNSHTQFGNSNSDLKVEDAELTNFEAFPAMYKSVEYGSNLFSISAGGDRVYRFSQSTGALSTTSEVGELTETKAICIGHNENDDQKDIIYVIDKVGSEYWLVAYDSGLRLVRRNLLQLSSANLGWDPCDMETSLNKIWIIKTHPGGNTTVNNFLYNFSYPTDSNAIAIVNADIPYQNPFLSGGSTPFGFNHFTAHGSDPTTTDARYRGFFMDRAKLPSNTNNPSTMNGYKTNLNHHYDNLCLSKAGASAGNKQIIVTTRSYIYNTTNDAYVLYHVFRYNDAVENFVFYAFPLGEHTAWIIDEDYPGDAHYHKNTVSSLSPGANDAGGGYTGIQTKDCVPVRLNSPALPTGTQNCQGLGQTHGDDFSTAQAFWYTIHSSTTTGVLAFHCLRYADYHDGIYGTNTVDLTNDLPYYTNYNIVHDAYFNKMNIVLTGSKMFLFEKDTGGRVGSYDVSNQLLSNFASLQKSNLGITATNSGGGTTLGFDAGKKYFYKVSFTYDGYQESPLTTSMSSPAASNQSKNIQIDIGHPDGLSSRVSHIKLYRAEAPTTGATVPTTLYRLVADIALNTQWTTVPSAVWGNGKRYTYTDTYVNGATYDSLAGISSVIPDTMINRGLSVALNNTLFVADCYHPRIDNAQNYMFKSIPYKYDMFDWSQDFLVLPNTPTALASFNGRIFAFTDNKIFRIEPNTFYIEDEFEGVGCSGSNSVCVTEYGMCFADKNNVYLHDGNKPIPIGNSILKSHDGNTGYQELYSGSPRVVFDGLRNSYIVAMSNTKAWCYNLGSKRWDLWSMPTTGSLGSLFSGRDGKVYVSQGTDLKTFSTHASNRKAFTWRSKKIIVARSTQDKNFYSLNKVGTGSVEINGTPTLPYKSKNIVVNASGTAGQEIDSIGVVFRSYIKIFDGTSSS